MVKSGVFEKVNLSKLLSDAKVIVTTWAMKKKSNGTLHGESMFGGSHKLKGSITMHGASVHLSQME
jgi:hypothetical protein